MTPPSSRRGRLPGRLLAVPLVALVSALGAAGCGGGGADVGEASAADATISVTDLSGFGEVLATGERPLYVLTSDPDGGSNCAGSCLQDFRPLAADELTAASGVDTGEITTFSRDDGGEQVAFAGHALYTYEGEGLIQGAGMTSGSGTWYLVGEDGEPIETTAAGGY